MKRSPDPRNPSGKLAFILRVASPIDILQIQDCFRHDEPASTHRIKVHEAKPGRVHLDDGAQYQYKKYMVSARIVSAVMSQPILRRSCTSTWRTRPSANTARQLIMQVCHQKTSLGWRITQTYPHLSNRRRFVPCVSFYCDAATATGHSFYLSPKLAHVPRE